MWPQGQILRNQSNKPWRFSHPITHILWELLQVTFCLVPNFPASFGALSRKTIFTCSTTGHSLRCSLNCHMRIPSGRWGHHIHILADSLHAEFGQHLLLCVLKGKVKDLIPKLYPLIQNRQGMIRKKELSGHRKSLVKQKGEKIRSGPYHGKVMGPEDPIARREWGGWERSA